MWQNLYQKRLKGEGFAWVHIWGFRASERRSHGRGHGEGACNRGPSLLDRPASIGSTKAKFLWVELDLSRLNRGPQVPQPPRTAAPVWNKHSNTRAHRECFRPIITRRGPPNITHTPPIAHLCSGSERTCTPSTTPGFKRGDVLTPSMGEPFRWLSLERCSVYKANPIPFWVSQGHNPLNPLLS